MSAQRKILVVDPDPDTLRTLGPALRRRGYHLHAARDGSRALQLAILRAPDLVLVDEDAPLVNARTFVRILRTNPRTAHIPVVLTGRGEDRERGRLAHFLPKPFDVDAVLARIEQIFRRADAARAVSGGAGLEGDLGQVPLVDLLQILTANRRTGRVELAQDGAAGSIALHDGRVVDATAGAVVGEKALFRLLARRGGSFSFRPGPGGGADRITRRIEELLLDGMRHADETARLRERLGGGGDDRFALAAPPPGGGPGTPSDPAEREVAALLATPSTLGELLDRAAASDLDVLGALAALLGRGALRRRPAPEATADPAPFLGAAELHALASRLRRGSSGHATAAGKVILAGGGPLARRAALSRWRGITGFEPVGDGGAAGFGTVGRLALGDGLRVDVVALPGDPGLEPLWPPFAWGAVGALVLLPADGLAGRVLALGRANRLPVGVCGPSAQSVDAELRTGESCAFLGADPVEALRALLLRASARPAGAAGEPPAPER